MDLLGERWCVDAVELVARGELLLSPPRLATWWRARSQTDVLENSPRDALVVDDGDDRHAVAAARALENVDAPRPAHEGLPVEPSLPFGIVGADVAVTPGRGCYARPTSEVEFSVIGPLIILRSGRRANSR